MTQHAILVGVVKMYKMTDISPSTQGMGTANSQRLNVYIISSLWNIFCLSLFFIKYLEHLCANPGCAVLPACQQLCHVHQSQVQKVEVCWKNFNSCTHQNIIWTRKDSYCQEQIVITSMVPWDYSFLSKTSRNSLLLAIVVEYGRPNKCV